MYPEGLIKLYIIVSAFILASYSTTISLTFSDGYKSHMIIAQKLHSLNMNATFFLNSNNLSFKTGWLDVFDINYIVSLGFEIGGHTP
jgi:hypothetical protein